MTFVAARHQLKELAQGDYCAIEYEESLRDGAVTEVECKVYIAGHGWHSANTWGAALQSLSIKLGNESPVVKGQHPTTGAH